MNVRLYTGFEIFKWNKVLISEGLGGAVYLRSTRRMENSCWSFLPPLYGPRLLIPCSQASYSASCGVIMCLWLYSRTACGGHKLICWVSAGMSPAQANGMGASCGAGQYSTVQVVTDLQTDCEVTWAVWAHFGVPFSNRFKGPVRYHLQCKIMIWDVTPCSSVDR